MPTASSVTIIHLNIQSIIPSIFYGNLDLIRSAIETARLKSAKPVNRLVEIYSG